jgi:hypothetical protein
VVRGRSVRHPPPTPAPKRGVLLGFSVCGLNWFELWFELVWAGIMWGLAWVGSRFPAITAFALRDWIAFVSLTISYLFEKVILA